MLMENVFKVADSLFVNYSSFQDRVFYNSNETRETHCHEGEIEKSKKQHSEGTVTNKQTHLMEIYVEMQKHFQTLNTDLLSTTKENGLQFYTVLQVILICCP
jgi:hypothetical protein